MQACGDVAEWLGNGLQIRVPRFDSGRRLDESPVRVAYDGRQTVIVLWLLCSGA